MVDSVQVLSLTQIVAWEEAAHNITCGQDFSNPSLAAPIKEGKFLMKMLALSYNLIIAQSRAALVLAGLRAAAQ